MHKQNKNQHHNRIAFFRRRRGLSQRRMANLLGHKSHGSLWTYERGVAMPSLETALKLEIILRTPVAFLFPELYEALRNQLRIWEEQTKGLGQQDLFDHSPARL